MPKVSELTSTPALGDGDLVYVVADGLSAKLASLRVADITALTAITTPLNGMSVEVTDVNRGGLFVFDTSVTEAGNGGTTFTADDGTTGSWVRQYSGPASVLWFGGLENALDFAAESNASVFIVSGNTIITGKEINDPTAIIGAGWNHIIKGPDGHESRMLTFRDMSGTRNVSAALIDIDGNGGGQLGDALVQINDANSLILGLRIHDSDALSVENGMNGINFAKNTSEISTCQLIGSRFERLSKAAINWTGNSRGGVLALNWILGGDTGFDRAPAIQVNRGSEAVLIGNYATDIEGSAILISENIDTSDDVVVVGNLIADCGLGSNAGVGIQAEAEPSHAGHGVLIAGNRIARPGVNVKSNGIDVTGYTNFNVVANSIESPTQNGLLIKDCAVGVVSGIDIFEPGDGAGSSDSFISINGCTDVSVSEITGRGGANTNYAITILGDNERISIRNNNFSLWQEDAPVNFVSSFPRDSYIEIPIDLTTVDNTETTVFAFDLEDDQCVFVEVDIIGIGGTNVRASKDTGVVVRRAGSAALVGVANVAEQETDAAMNGRVLTTSGGARYRVTGLTGESIRWRGVAKVRSVSA